MLNYFVSVFFVIYLEQYANERKKCFTIVINGEKISMVSICNCTHLFDSVA